MSGNETVRLDSPEIPAPTMMTEEREGESMNACERGIERF